MSEYFWQSGLKTQQRTIKERMLRGYDPLREIVYWQLIISSSVMGIVVVTYVLSPMLNSISYMDGESWSVPFFLAILAFLPLFSGLALLWYFRRNWRASKKRERLRRAALGEDTLPSVPFQPAPFYRWTLPLHLESHAKKRRKVWVSVMVSLIIADFLVNYLIYNHLWNMSSLFVSLPPFLFVLLAYGGILISRVIEEFITEHYLFPWLHVDDTGISARYGNDTILMRWQDIRSFALVSAVLGSPMGWRMATPAKNREAFEICDGENMICWQVASLPGSYHLSLSGQTVSSPQDYDAFVQQLAALIVEHTGLPLYDFRAPVRKRKEKERVKKRGENKKRAYM